MNKILAFILLLLFAGLAHGQHWSDWERIHPILYKDVHLRVKCTVSGEETQKASYEIEFRNMYFQDMFLRLSFSPCTDCEESEIFTQVVETGKTFRQFVSFTDTECRNLNWDIKEVRFIKPD